MGCELVHRLTPVSGDGSQSEECLPQARRLKRDGPEVREYPALNPTSLLCVSDQYPPSIKGPDVIKAYMGQTTVVNYTSNAKDITFTLRENCMDFKLFGKNTWLGVGG